MQKQKTNKKQEIRMGATAFFTALPGWLSTSQYNIPSQGLPGKTLLREYS